MNTKKDFINFLKNDCIVGLLYSGKKFSKEIKDQEVYIFVEENNEKILIYRIDFNQKIIFIEKALYCFINREEYWLIDKIMEFKSKIVDKNTLIRINTN